ERQVGPDRDGGSFVSLGDDLEEQLGAAGVDLDVPELVKQEEVQAAVAADDPGQRPLVGGFDELVDQGCGGDVADPAALFAGGQGADGGQLELAGRGADGGLGGSVGYGGHGMVLVSSWS